MYLVVIENVIDLIFVIDIVQSFFVSYVDTFSGDVITQPKLIAKRYMKGQFTIDMVSTMPFQRFGVLVGIQSFVLMGKDM